MKIKYVILMCALVVVLGFKSDKPAYVIYGEKGKSVQYKDMLSAALSADIVFFGEHHDNPITHWLQLELTKDLFEKKQQDLVLGAEMFESDNQLVLDEYIQGLIKENKFEADCRLWPNYKTDYKPLVNFAKENELKFVASNVPRRYASIVYKGGFEALQGLTDEAKKYLPPLPITYNGELKCYSDMLNMEGMGHASANLPKSQNVKDATMAHFILQNWVAGNTLLHYNGAYHSANREGIVWHVLNQNPELKIVTITTVSQVEVEKLEKDNKGSADFTICVPETMTSTH
ncbi:MAG: ChaN family lipoprotein [Flavobacteriales bacterium]|nr:ChaN family lipoprotein [Flavobacteriales bacterium]